MGAPIRVLIVDDSALVRHILSTGLAEDPDIEVVGTAHNPYVARDLLVKCRPDVITLDVEMPRMDGVTFLKKYMQILPTPTIVLSALTQAGKKVTIEALEAGAVFVVGKPVVGLADNLPPMLENLRTKIKQAVQIDISRYMRKRSKYKPPRPLERTQPLNESTDQVLALGASTGGVEALARIMPLFPPAAPGIIIVEHIPAGFSASFAERLNSLCQIQVKEAAHGDRVRPGMALVAPGGDKHLKLKRSGGQYLVELCPGEKVSNHCPSIDVCFESIAQEAGSNASAALMTGMGGDGAQGLLKIRQAGGRTFAQSEETCVIYGMPRVAVELDAAEHSVDLLEIPSALLQSIDARRSPIA